MSISNNIQFELKNIEKRFPGVHALNNVSIKINKNEVVGLIGENGAGKTTLMRIIAGSYKQDSGNIIMNGKEIYLDNPKEAFENGIGMVFQEQSLLPNLTVGENIFLGNEKNFKKYGIINWNKLYNESICQLKKLKLEIDPKIKTEKLNFATRQMVELAKVLKIEEKLNNNLLILLDEPTSVLEKSDIKILFEKIKELKKRSSFLFVSHRIEEVLEISDRVYVMKNGEVVCDIQTKDADVDKLHNLMVGRGLKKEYYKETKQQNYQDNIILKVTNLNLKGHFKDVSFKLHAGEVLGITGVIGSGRESICRSIFGFLKPDTGEIEIFNKLKIIESPSVAVKNWIGYIPKERRYEGIVLFLPVSSNITLANIKKIIKNYLINFKLEKIISNEWIQKLKIKTPSISTLCLNLSGGNQQKVVLSKWMNANSKIIILDHPTRGLDVGAKEEVYELIRSMSKSGIGIILTSDTLEETIGLSHNIIVMRDGEIKKTIKSYPNEKPNQVDLIKYMV